MSITSLGAGLAPLNQASTHAATKPPAHARESHQARPHNDHDGDEKPSASTSSAKATSAATSGSRLNQLV